MQAIKLGIISDVQYCDCENALNFEKTQERFYRNSINHLDNSINYFLSNDCVKVLQLGDLIDGKCKRLKITDNVMQLISQRFETNKFETFHVVGNHELYNLSREKLLRSFIGNSLNKYHKENSDLHYYKVNLSSEICLIVLDCYEISVLNERENVIDHPDVIEAREILRANNHNESWDDPVGLRYAKFVAFNGGIGERQLNWLERQLQEAALNEQIVILAGHIPILSASSDPLCLVWNDADILQMIKQYPCVKAYICGHNHIASFIKTDQFIHITMPGVIEAFVDQHPYGILEITKEKLRLSPMKGYWNEIIFNF